MSTSIFTFYTSPTERLAACRNLPSSSMIQYIVLSIILFYLAFHLFLKIRFRFWSVQPVFHMHNVQYWLAPPGLLQHALPPKTKYFDDTIACKPFSCTTDHERSLFCCLIQNHYLNDKGKATYAPSQRDVLAYLEGHQQDPYVTLNREAFIDSGNPVQGYAAERRLASAMTSRTVECILHGKSMPISLVDFLCVHQAKRKQGVAPRTIYTHYRKSRALGAPAAFLFKREGDINFMVPMVVYEAVAFKTSALAKPNFRIPNTITCRLITGADINLFYHFLDEIKEAFGCFVAPSVSHIKHMVEEKQLFVCLVMDRDSAVGCYIFRDPHTSYDGKASVECNGSFFVQAERSLGWDCFPNALTLVKQVLPFDIVLIENISNNDVIIGKMLTRQVPMWKCPMAYYLYNFIYRPFLSNDVFIAV